jgi:hypothetical protein
VDILKKEVLPAGWSYALKPSRLEEAIAEAGIQLPVTLHQWHKRWAANAPAFSATFYPRGSYLGGEHGCFSVTSCAVPSSQRQAIQVFAERIFLPELVAWIMSVEELSEDSTLKREKQEFACDGSPPALNKRPLALASKGQRRRKRA